MSIFAMGDLHLSLSCQKSMEVFPGWENYVERISRGWCSVVGENDTVVLVGDTSWGMSLLEAKEDFRFIHRLPGRKLILKGNHDYWWSTRQKMEQFFSEEGLSSLSILHNSAAVAENFILCGSRGWLFEHGQAQDKKIVAREAQRLDLSLTALPEAVGERVAFLHYPPLYQSESTPEILEVLQKRGVTRCYYGHIHAEGKRFAYSGLRDGVFYRLVSADFLGFVPYKLPEFEAV